MTSDLDTRGRSTGDVARSRSYLRDFLPAVLGYLLVLALVVALGDLDGTSPWRFAWALLPVLPLLWMVRAVARHLRRTDEYQRLLTLEGLAVGFVVAMVTAVTCAFLELAGLAMPTGWIVWGAGMLSWAVAAAVTARR